jgi:hypothetical protein
MTVEIFKILFSQFSLISSVTSSKLNPRLSNMAKKTHIRCSVRTLLLTQQLLIWRTEHTSEKSKCLMINTILIPSAHYSLSSLLLSSSLRPSINFNYQIWLNRKGIFIYINCRRCLRCGDGLKARIC